MHLPSITLAGQAERVCIGKFMVGDTQSAFRATLGSCVGLCMIWAKSNTFALCHVLLPSGSERTATLKQDPSRYADQAVPFLIEELGATQARKGQLTAFVAGGSNMFRSGEQKEDVGGKNVEAILSALEHHRVRILGTDVGGTHGRQIVAHAASRTVVSMNLEEDGEDVRWEFPRIFGIEEAA